MSVEPRDGGAPPEPNIDKTTPWPVDSTAGGVPSWASALFSSEEESTASGHSSASSTAGAGHPSTNSTAGDGHPSTNSTAGDGPQSGSSAAQSSSSGRLAPEYHFQPEDLLAGRYRIIRFIAKGAMGQVYEAEDLELRERVALKALSPEVSSKPEALDRFRREIHLARRVTHPNVCRIFDLERHELPPLEEGKRSRPVLFLSMELLDGETLASRLRREGPMTPEQVMPILRQMVAGLKAAHDVGIVHRDFKSGNVLLVETERGLRAAITDFGLASRAATDGGSEDKTLTRPGTMLGTPAYMAPEQVTGEEVTPAADIYALGIVLYEMLSNKRPFQAKSAMAQMVARIQKMPTSPRLHVPELPPRWESAIMRCLEREPSARYARVEEILQAVEEDPNSISGAQLVSRQPPYRRLLAASLILAATLGLGFLGVRNWWGQDATDPERGAVQRRSAAVLGFKNLSGLPEAAWLSDALRELLASELAAGERLRIASGDSVARLKQELGLVDPDAMSPELLQKIRQNLDTELLLMGSYLLQSEGLGGKLRLDISVLDAATGKITVRLTETGSEAELLDLMPRLGNRLRAALGLASLSSAEMGGRQASQPRNTEAARLYAEGLGKLRQSEALAARDLLQRAIVADSEFPLSHSALAAAWSALGYDAKAQEEAKRAFELASALSREEQLTVEGRYREANHEWDKAAAVYGALWSFFPDDLEHGLRLALVQGSGGRGEDALATVASLRKLPPPSGNDPRIDLAEAAAAHSLSDFQRQLDAAARAAAEGKNRGVRLVVAQALMSEWWARRTRGELTQAVAAATEAKAIYTEAGYLGGIAQASNAMATVFLDQRDLDAAFQADTEALEVFREIGDQRRMSWSLNNLGHILRERGELEGSLQRFEESIRLCRELGDRSGLARGLSNAGRVLMDQARLQQARARFEESIALRRESGDKRGIAGALLDFGALAWRHGELTEAKARLLEATEGFRDIGDKQSLAFCLWYLAETLLAGGDLSGARVRHQEALALREAIGSRRLIAVSRLSLAGLLVDENKPIEAEAALRSLLTPDSGSLTRLQRASGLALLARALQEQGKLDEAKTSAAEAKTESSSSELLAERLGVLVPVLQVQAAKASTEEITAAQSGLQTIATQAKEAKLGLLEMKARLAACQILEQGDPQRLACLKEVQTEAASRGLGLLERQATQTP